MKKIIADVPEKKKRSDNINLNHLFHEGKKFTKKVMISAGMAFQNHFFLDEAIWNPALGQIWNISEMTSYLLC